MLHKVIQVTRKIEKKRLKYLKILERGQLLLELKQMILADLHYRGLVEIIFTYYE